MFERLARIMRGRTEIPERIQLRPDGFDLYRGESLAGSVQWRDVEKITAFKADLLAYDLACLELELGSEDQSFGIHEEVEGFWELVRRIKDVFPDSRQDWESGVLQPAFARRRTVIFERENS